MDKLTLADIQALAASPDYGGRGFLQSSSAVLGLSAAAFLSDLSLWQGAGYKLTDGEIDDIQAMIAQLEEDLMVTDNMYPIDRVRVRSSVDITVQPSVARRLYFNTEYYDPAEMHDTSINRDRLYAVNDGLHIISVNVVWGANPVGVRSLSLYKYDASLASITLIAFALSEIVSGVAGISQFITIQDWLEEGDYLYLNAYQTSPDPIIMAASDYAPVFSMVRL